MTQSQSDAVLKCRFTRPDPLEQVARRTTAEFCAILLSGLLFLASTPAASTDLFKSGIRYRNGRDRHKAIVYSSDQDLYRSLLDSGATPIDDYGSFALLSVPDDSLQRAEARTRSNLSVRDDLDLILLRAGPFDTQQSATDTNHDEPGL